MHKLECDGVYCRHATAELRVFPASPESKVLYCHACYLNEVQFRKVRNRSLAKEYQFDIPFWENLEIYKGEG